MSTAPSKASGASATSVESGASEVSSAARGPAFPNIESILTAPTVTQTFGLVQGREGTAYVVRAGADVIHAQRATGCLVEPGDGDTVLVARSEHHGSFVLSVLIASQNSEKVVAVDGNLTLRSNDGKVSIVGADGVSVTSMGEVAVNAPTVVARTTSATIFASTLSYVGRKLDAHVERVKVLGQVLETAIDRVTSRVKYSYRTIDELEKVNAKELHVNAEATLNLHGKNTLMTAEKLAKMDGEQIHIG